MPEWKKPESFQQVIKIVRAMMHIENVQKCSSTSDALGGIGDEKSTMSGRGEEDIFSILGQACPDQGSALYELNSPWTKQSVWR